MKMGSEKAYKSFVKQAKDIIKDIIVENFNLKSINVINIPITNCFYTSRRESFIVRTIRNDTNYFLRLSEALRSPFPPIHELNQTLEVNGIKMSVRLTLSKKVEKIYLSGGLLYHILTGRSFANIVPKIRDTFFEVELPAMSFLLVGKGYYYFSEYSPFVLGNLVIPEKGCKIHFKNTVQELPEYIKSKGLEDLTFFEFFLNFFEFALSESEVLPIVQNSFFQDYPDLTDSEVLNKTRMEFNRIKSLHYDKVSEIAGFFTMNNEEINGAAQKIHSKLRDSAIIGTNAVDTLYNFLLYIKMLW